MTETSVTLRGGPFDGGAHEPSSPVETWGLIKRDRAEPPSWALYRTSLERTPFGDAIWDFERELSSAEIRSDEN